MQLSKIFDSIKNGLSNAQTTVAGGLVGVLVYLQGVGAKVPETTEEWYATVLGAALAWFGIQAKDAKTGSKAK